MVLYLTIILYFYLILTFNFYETFSKLTSTLSQVFFVPKIKISILVTFNIYVI